MLISRFRKLIVRILLAMDFDVATISKVVRYSKVTVYRIKNKLYK